MRCSVYTVIAPLKHTQMTQIRDASRFWPRRGGTTGGANVLDDEERRPLGARTQRKRPPCRAARLKPSFRP